MRIIKLQASNFKKLKAIQIKPTGEIVEITGKNGAGKSSILDSIWAALGGAEAIPDVPVREGAKEAIVILDLGEMTVTRKFRPKDDGSFTTSLVIENKDGTRHKSPQTLLDDMMGRYSMDPLAFSRLSPKGQFDALKVLVPGLDLDDIKAQDDADYEKRTFENRKAKEARAAIASLGAKDGKAERVNTAQITADIARASEFNRVLAEREARRKAAEDLVTRNRAMILVNNKEIERLKGLITELEQENTSREGQALELEKKLQEAPPLDKPLDTQELAKALAAANLANQEAEKQEQRDKLIETAEQHENAATALTQSMEARAEYKNAAIAAAKFPVEGLTLGNEEVLLSGLPFAQAAASQKIKTSVALAMALNPKIRVIRIEDGSLLDTDSMRTIASMAKENDYQIWVETVGEGPGGIVIEDGHIKEN